MSVGFLVGPGVLGHLDPLHAAAERIGVAVINTWGAKGVFRWDSPLHGGTAGLQRDDFALAGLDRVDLLITSGLDEHEVTSRPWEGRAEVRDVAPTGLARLADEWDRPGEAPVRPALYTELSAVIMPMYGDPGTPPARARSLAEGLRAGARVYAPPGLVGYWVARTLPTTQPGSVVVPAVDEPGLTERLAREASQDGLDVTYVTDRPVDLPDAVNVERWDDLDLTLPDELIEVAGPIVAWT